MARQDGSGESAGVTEVRERIEQWRRTRTKLSPMPEALWRGAIALTRRKSVYGVARALGIQYAALRQRVNKQHGVVAKGNGRQRVNGFVEVSGAALVGSGGPVVELTDRRGVQVTVRFGAGTQLAVTDLVKAFRRRRG